MKGGLPIQGRGVSPGKNTLWQCFDKSSGIKYTLAGGKERMAKSGRQSQISLLGPDSYKGGILPGRGPACSSGQARGILTFQIMQAEKGLPLKERLTLAFNALWVWGN